MTERPSWDDVWMATADAVAKRSLCSRAQVGTVIVSSDNRVQAVSFNGAPDAIDVHGLPCTEWCERSMTGESGPSYDTCQAVHSEAQAIARANWDHIQGGTVYTCSATCINCARLIVTAGIARVVHRVDPSQTYRNPDAVEAYFRSAGVIVDRC